jgi:hypothetical protein
MRRYALDAAGLDWIGHADHDNGAGREHSWWIAQKTTDLCGMSERFTPAYRYERSTRYPDGNRTVVLARRSFYCIRGEQTDGGRGRIAPVLTTCPLR